MSSILTHMPIFLPAIRALAKLFAIFVKVDVAFVAININIPRFSFANDHFWSLVQLTRKVGLIIE